MRASFLMLLVAVCSHEFSAFPSFPSFPTRTDGRILANNERYQMLKELWPAMREALGEDRYVEKRNQEIITAFNSMKELKDMLRSG